MWYPTIKIYATEVKYRFLLLTSVWDMRFDSLISIEQLISCLGIQIRYAVNEYKHFNTYTWSNNVKQCIYLYAIAYQPPIGKQHCPKWTNMQSRSIHEISPIEPFLRHPTRTFLWPASPHPNIFQVFMLLSFYINMAKLALWNVRCDPAI